jgi:hypothetical protein
MSFLSRLFGGGSDRASGGAAERAKDGAALGEDSYKGFTIKAIEMRAGSEYQLAGVIEKEIGGELQSYKFVRADRMSNRDELIALALSKGRQIVDEQGERVFTQTGPMAGNLPPVLLASFAAQLLSDWGRGDPSSITAK